MMPHPKIKSGSELDWEMVRKAAKDILKQADNADYRPPEDINGHIHHVHKVCHAMNAIRDALKLRQINEHELTGTAECDLMNSSHPHADGYVWAKCLCGWQSHPIRSRDSGTIFSAHVQQETNTALIEATKHGKALSND